MSDMIDSTSIMICPHCYKESGKFKAVYCNMDLEGNRTPGTAHCDGCGPMPMEELWVTGPALLKELEDKRNRRRRDRQDKHP